MEKNMGNNDKIFRVLVAVLVAILYFTGVIPGAIGIGLMVVAVIFVATSLLGFCPIYAATGMNTCSTKEKKS